MKSRVDTRFIIKIVESGGSNPIRVLKIKITRGGPLRLIFFKAEFALTPPYTRGRNPAHPRFGTYQGPKWGGQPPTEVIFVTNAT